MLKAKAMYTLLFNHLFYHLLSLYPRHINVFEGLFEVDIDDGFYLIQLDVSVAVTITRNSDDDD